MQQFPPVLMLCFSARHSHTHHAQSSLRMLLCAAHGGHELMNPDFWRQIGDTLETWDRIGTGLGLAFFSRAEH